MKKPSPQQPTKAEQRARYARTGLFRLGIPFERAIQCESVRIVIGMASVPRRNSQPHPQQEAA